MFSRSKKLLVTITILVISLLVFAGAALAQETQPDTPDPEKKAPIQQMQEWMGAEAWGEMIRHMTEIHGAEFTGQMMQQMNENGSCHGGGFMGNWGGMMGNGNDTGTWGTMRSGMRNMMNGFSGMGGGIMNGFGR